VRLEGLGKLREKNAFSSGLETRDLPACSIVPKPLRYCVPLFTCSKFLWQFCHLIEICRDSLLKLSVSHVNLMWPCGLNLLGILGH
jgi:hypothetical protein